MDKKVLFLDSLPINSGIQVGSHKYALLFRKNGYKVFSLSHSVNAYRLLRQNSEDKELIRSWKNGVRKSKDGIFFYAPFCLFPYVNLPLLNSLKVAYNCLKFCNPNLKEIMQKTDFVNTDILFVNDISSISVLKFVNTKIIILRISDRIESFKNAPSTISLLKNEITKNSDLVFATSKNLTDEATTINKNTFHLPNGVDEEFIERISGEHSSPEAYKNIKKPIAVYIGAISDWFDYDLYEYGLAKVKNASFAMIGPITGANSKVNESRIRRFAEMYKNFHYLGAVAHSEIKKYLIWADIGVIPFQLGPLTNEINPVKFFEYAASGLPTLASPMTELQNYREYVSFYKSKEEYVSLLSNHFEKKTYQSRRLIEFARNNTWERRFKFILAQVEKVRHEKLLQF